MVVTKVKHDINVSLYPCQSMKIEHKSLLEGESFRVMNLWLCTLLMQPTAATMFKIWRCGGQHLARPR